MVDRNSLLFWYPKIKDVVPTPRTVWVEIPEDELPIRWLDSDIPERLERRFKEKAREIGYPLFMRTDHFSGKHEYEHTCYVPSEDKLIPNLYSLIEMNYIVDVFGLPIGAIVFREFVELDYEFRAFYGKLPIAVEVRWFIRNGDVQCCHFYWKEDAIVLPDVSDWMGRLRRMEKRAYDELDIHKKLALKVAKVMDGYWSVDFARTKSGEWICIDMALGERSYHPSECPHLSEEERIIMLEYESAHRPRKPSKSLFDFMEV